MITALAAATLTCWLAVLVARPRTPLPNNEVQELVYARLLGRQQMLALLALIVTAISFLLIVATLPQRIDPDLRLVRHAKAACIEAQHVASDALDYGATVLPHCFELQAGGGWVAKAQRPDGSWQVIGTVSAPSP